MEWKRWRMLGLSVVSVLVIIIFGCWIMKDSSLSKEASVIKNNSASENLSNSSEPLDSKEPINSMKPAVTSKPQATQQQTEEPSLVQSSKNPTSSVPVETKQHIVAIDAGHQKKGNYEKEPIGPGAKKEKPKVSSGTQGRYTGLAEYQLNLDVSKKLRTELEKRGYQVVMIRETNDVNISNQERAKLAAKKNADILVRIHANGSENKSVHGILTICPTKESPYVKNLYQSCYSLSECILNKLIKWTGAQDKGITQTDSMSGINWSTIPVTIVEMGYMTNQKEDQLMATDSYQNKITLGVAEGIDDYFANLK